MARNQAAPVDSSPNRARASKLEDANSVRYIAAIAGNQRGPAFRAGQTGGCIRETSIIDIFSLLDSATDDAGAV